MSGQQEQTLPDAAFPMAARGCAGHYYAQDQLVILQEGPAGSFDLPDGDDRFLRRGGRFEPQGEGPGACGC
jgi:hypothetical protein